MAINPSIDADHPIVINLEPEIFYDAPTYLMDQVDSLRTACFQNDLNTVQNIVAEHYDIVHVDLYKGWQVLHWAAWRGHTGLVKELIEVGSDPEITCEGGETPAILAWQGGHIEAWELFPFNTYNWEFIDRKEKSHWLNETGTDSIQGKTIPLEKSISPWFYGSLGRRMESEDPIRQPFLDAEEPRDLVEVATAIQEGDLTLIDSGYRDHSKTIVFYKGKMAVCDSAENDIRVFEIDPQRVTSQLLDRIEELKYSQVERKHARQFLMSKLPRILGGTGSSEIKYHSLGELIYSGGSTCCFKSKIVAIHAIRCLLDPQVLHNEHAANTLAWFQEESRAFL